MRGFGSNTKVKHVYARRREAEAPPTKFQYFRRRPNDYILILDLDSYGGGDDGGGDEWTAARRALLDLVTLIIPSGSMLSVWSLGEEVVQNLSPSVVSNSNRLKKTQKLRVHRVEYQGNDILFVPGWASTVASRGGLLRHPLTADAHLMMTVLPAGFAQRTSGKSFHRQRGNVPLAIPYVRVCTFTTSVVQLLHLLL